MSKGSAIAAFRQAASDLPGHYAVVPLSLYLFKGVKGVDVRLYELLRCVADKGIVSRSTSYLAKMLGIDTRNVRQSLERMSDGGCEMIVREKGRLRLKPLRAVELGRAAMKAWLSEGDSPLADGDQEHPGALVMMPLAAITDKKLTPTARRLLALYLAASDNVTGQSHWGWRAISEVLQIASQTIYKARDLLAERGYIRWWRAGRRTKVQILDLPSVRLESGCASDDGDPGDDDGGGRGTPSSPDERISERGEADQLAGQEPEPPKTLSSTGVNTRTREAQGRSGRGRVTVEGAAQRQALVALKQHVGIRSTGEAVEAIRNLLDQGERVEAIVDKIKSYGRYADVVLPGEVFLSKIYGKWAAPVRIQREGQTCDPVKAVFEGGGEGHPQRQSRNLPGQDAPGCPETACEAKNENRSALDIMRAVDAETDRKRWAGERDRRSGGHRVEVVEVEDFQPQTSDEAMAWVKARLLGIDRRKP